MPPRDDRLLCCGGGLPDADRDFRRMQQRVVNQTMMDRARDAGLMLLGQLDWSFDFDPKIVDAATGSLTFSAVTRT